MFRAHTHKNEPLFYALIYALLSYKYFKNIVQRQGGISITISQNI